MPIPSAVVDRVTKLLLLDMTRFLFGIVLAYDYGVLMKGVNTYQLRLNIAMREAVSGGDRKTRSVMVMAHVLGKEVFEDLLQTTR